MASYEVKLSSSARKELASLGTKHDRGQIVAALQGLASNPRPVGSVKLAGSDRTYRIRIGDYRVIYEVLDAVLLVDVIRIGHRRDVYR